MFVKKKKILNQSQATTSYHQVCILWVCDQLQSVTTTSGYHHHFLKTNINLLSVTGTKAKEACKRINHMSTCIGNDTSNSIEYWHVSSWKLRHFGQSNGAMCLGEKILNFLYSNCDICHQSNSFTCRLTFPNSYK